MPFTPDSKASRNRMHVVFGSENHAVSTGSKTTVIFWNIDL